MRKPKRTPKRTSPEKFEQDREAELLRMMEHVKSFQEIKKDRADLFKMNADLNKTLHAMTELCDQQRATIERQETLMATIKVVIQSYGITEKSDGLLPRRF